MHTHSSSLSSSLSTRLGTRKGGGAASAGCCPFLLRPCESHDLLASNAFVSHPIKLVGKVWLYRCHNKAAHISRAHFQSHHVGILDLNQALSRSPFPVRYADTRGNADMHDCLLLLADVVVGGTPRERAARLLLACSIHCCHRFILVWQTADGRDGENYKMRTGMEAVVHPWCCASRSVSSLHIMPCLQEIRTRRTSPSRCRRYKQE